MKKQLLLAVVGCAMAQNVTLARCRHRFYSNAKTKFDFNILHFVSCFAD